MDSQSLFKTKTEALVEILTNDSSKTDKLCRICLCDIVDKVVPLFEDCQGVDMGNKALRLWEKLILCGRVKVSGDDKLPKIICQTCNIHLDAAYSFKMKCQWSDSLLRKVLENVEIKYEQKCEGELTEASKDGVDVIEIKQENDEDFDSFFDDALPDENFFTNTSKRCKKIGDNVTKAKKKKKNKLDEVFLDLKVEGDDISKKEENEELNINNECLKYVCDICNKCMKNKYILAKHIKVLHGVDRPIKMKKPDIGPVTGYGAERRFHCPECDYKCRRRQTLQYHMSTHTGEKPFKCDECPRSFAQHASLYTHKKTHSDKTYYTCTECGRQFKHYGIFRNHRKVHSDEYNFVCTICNKAMKSQKTLNDHMNRHMEIKRYSCEYCGRAFVTQSCLILHLRTHKKNTERKYKCTFCELGFHSKGALDVHIKRHTGTRNFPCELCSHTCYTRGELKTHIRKHTKEQNYSCPLCEMKFRHSPSLNKHMLNKHGEKFKWSSTVDRRIIK